MNNNEKKDIASSDFHGFAFKMTQKELDNRSYVPAGKSLPIGKMLIFLLIFPVPVTTLVVQAKKLPLWAKIVLLTFTWAQYLILVVRFFMELF